MTLVNTVCTSTTFLLKTTSNSHYKDGFNGHRRWTGLFKDSFYKYRLWNWSNLINFHLFPSLSRATLTPVWVILRPLSLFVLVVVKAFQHYRGYCWRWSSKVIFQVIVVVDGHCERSFSSIVVVFQHCRGTICVLFSSK